MREVFGDGRVVAHPAGGFGLEAPGLKEPALLLPSTNGTVVPDLTAQIGTVISYVGVLSAPTGDLSSAALHCVDLQLPTTDPAPSPMWAVVSGNLGKAPELNPKKDRYTASLAYHKQGDETSWLRVTAYSYYSIADLFSTLEPGTGLIAYGAIETYTYNDKERLQLALRGMQLLRSGLAAPKPPISLLSARTTDDIAEHVDFNAA